MKAARLRRERVQICLRNVSNVTHPNQTVRHSQSPQMHLACPRRSTPPLSLNARRVRAVVHDRCLKGTLSCNLPRSISPTRATAASQTATGLSTGARRPCCVRAQDTPWYAVLERNKSLLGERNAIRSDVGDGARSFPSSPIRRVQMPYHVRRPSRRAHRKSSASNPSNAGTVKSSDGIQTLPCRHCGVDA